MHLVLWDEDELEIAGAYRIGECAWILSWLGKEGLYMDELCEISDTLDILFNNQDYTEAFFYSQVLFKRISG